jgi:5-methylcytosine-specific restriction endonuclease McrA
VYPIQLLHSSIYLVVILILLFTLFNLVVSIAVDPDTDWYQYIDDEVGRAGAGPPIRPSTSLPTRKKVKKGKRTKQAEAKKEKALNRISQEQSVASGLALTEQELSHHVSDVYTHGPGGHIRNQEERRKRLAAITEQNDYLKKLDGHPALVLNADYAPMSYLPLSMWHWQEAIKAVFSGKCTVVDVYPDVTIRAASLEIPLPAVIALTQYVPQFKQRPAFTKRNVFLRDEYRCQYCLRSFHTRDLSLDHVVPRCTGGRLTWENAVTSCRCCNGRKGSLPVSQLRQVNMKLAREPFVPTQFQLAAIAGRMVPAKVHATWQPYLGLAAGSNRPEAIAFAEIQAMHDDKNNRRTMDR